MIHFRETQLLSLCNGGKVAVGHHVVGVQAKGDLLSAALTTLTSCLPHTADAIPFGRDTSVLRHNLCIIFTGGICDERDGQTAHWY